MPQLPPVPDDPDDLNVTTPNRPSELVALSDDAMFRMLRKVAFANGWGVDTKIQFEATARLIAALKEFKESSDSSARRLFWATVALVVLTVALVILTGVIVWLTTELE